MCKEVGVDRCPLSFRGSQLLTCHGNLATYLRRMGLRRDGFCTCGRSEEDSRHVREECDLGERERVREDMRESGVVWEELRLRVGGKLNNTCRE